MFMFQRLREGPGIRIFNVALVLTVLALSAKGQRLRFGKGHDVASRGGRTRRNAKALRR